MALNSIVLYNAPSNKAQETVVECLTEVPLTKHEALWENSVIQNDTVKAKCACLLSDHETQQVNN